MPFVIEYVSNHLTAEGEPTAKKTTTLADALDQLGEAAGFNELRHEDVV